MAAEQRAVIARMWRGAVRSEDADEYAAYIHATGIREYLATPGNAGAWFLRRARGELTEIVTLSLWESMDAIRAFAGDEPERAKYYPEDDRFLVEREDVVEHYEVG